MARSQCYSIYFMGKTTTSNTVTFSFGEEKTFNQKYGRMEEHGKFTRTSIFKDDSLEHYQGQIIYETRCNDIRSVE